MARRLSRLIAELRGAPSAKDGEDAIALLSVRFGQSDAALVALARLSMAPRAPWSSDRYEDVHFVPPALPWLRRSGTGTRG